MSFYATLDFKRGPSYATKVDAIDEATAKRIAMQQAQQDGFTAAIKRVSVVALATEQN